MAKYTTEIRTICENAAGYDESRGYSDVESIIQVAVPKIFDFDFPIFDPSYRNVLATKILRHYYTREIGFETVGLWKLKLNTALNEIMPFYNKLYESELIKFNPMYDMDLRTTNIGQKDSNTDTSDNRSSITDSQAEQTSGDKTTTSSTTASAQNGTTTGNEAETRTAAESTNQSDSKTGSSTSATGSVTSEEVDRKNATENTAVTAGSTTDSDSRTHWDLYSDTPQGQLTGVEDGDYLTNARKITDSDTRTGRSSGTDTATGSSTETGSTSRTGNETTVTGDEEQTRSEGSRTTTEGGNRNNTETSTDNRTEVTAGESSRQGSSLNSNRSTGLETGSSSNRFNSTESYVLHVIGKNAGTSYSKLLLEFRETFLNIDLEIIGQLSNLFFNLW